MLYVYNICIYTYTERETQGYVSYAQTIPKLTGPNPSSALFGLIIGKLKLSPNMIVGFGLFLVILYKKI